MKRILPILLLIPLPLLAQLSNSPVGQVASLEASVDGLSVPSGTTVLDGSRVATDRQAATIHLLNGLIVRVNSNSTALFSREQDGVVQIVAERGTVSVRNPNGETSTIAAYQQPAAQGNNARSSTPKTSKPEPGVVALVGGSQKPNRAESGTTIVPVNDTSRVELADPMLLKTNMNRKKKPELFCQEVICRIQAANDRALSISDKLMHTFEPDDFVIQQNPVPENRIYTQLRNNAKAGTTHLSVLDSKAINPLASIVIQSEDGRFREPACVKTASEILPDKFADIIESRKLEMPNLPVSVIELREELQHNYSKGAKIIQGLSFTDQRVVAKLAGDLYAGATALEVEDASGMDPLQQVILNNPNGTRREAYCIGSIEIQPMKPGEEKKLDRVTLTEGLDHGYPEGSELIQGKPAFEMVAANITMQRLTDCRCCRGEPVPESNLWDKPLTWIIIGGAGGATIRTLLEDRSASPHKP